MEVRFLKTLIITLTLAILPVEGLYAQSFNVDSALSAMTLEEKIGQLFMVAAYSNKGEEHQAELEALVRDYHIGGVIVMQGGPERQKKLLHRLQGAATFPIGFRGAACTRRRPCYRPTMSWARSYQIPFRRKASDGR